MPNDFAEVQYFSQHCCQQWSSDEEEEEEEENHLWGFPSIPLGVKVLRADMPQKEICF